MRRWEFHAGSGWQMSQVLGLGAEKVDHVFRRKLRQAILEEWKRLAGRHVDPKRLERYIKGMNVTQAGHKINLVLSGWDAVRVERGWAPSQQMGGDLTDGLDTYDGTEKDLRPSVLGGLSRRVIKFDFAKNANQLIDEYREASMQRYTTKAVSKQLVAAGIDHYSQEIRKLKFSPRGGPYTSPSKEFEFDGSTFRVPLPKLKWKHKSSIYSNIVRTVKADGKRGWVYSIFRMMVADGQKGLWMTRGTPPSNIFEKLLVRLPDIVQTLLEDQRP